MMDSPGGAGMTVDVATVLTASALVGIGAFGAQTPVLCVELRDGVPASDWARIESGLRHLGEGHVHTAHVQRFLHYPKAFPVDIRHNAKIGREKLAVWAAGRARI